MSNDLLLWLDLETTGVDERAGDEIVEIGCVITTTDLEQLASFTAVVQPSKSALDRLLANDVVREMHEKSGLLDELLSENMLATTLEVATKEIIELLEECGATKGEVILAGSGIGHLDHRFIQFYMPELAEWLRYWLLDIGVVRRAHAMWVGTVPSTANDDKTHRALDDVYCHIADAQAMKDLWQAELV